MDTDCCRICLGDSALESLTEKLEIENILSPISDLIEELSAVKVSFLEI